MFLCNTRFWVGLQLCDMRCICGGCLQSHLTLPQSINQLRCHEMRPISGDEPTRSIWLIEGEHWRDNGLHTRFTCKGCLATQFSIGAFVKMSIHTHIHTYRHTYILTYILTYLLTYIHTYIITYTSMRIYTYQHTLLSLSLPVLVSIFCCRACLIIFRTFPHTKIISKRMNYCTSSTCSAA